MKTIVASISPVTKAFGPLTTRRYNTKNNPLLHSDCPKSIQKILHLVGGLFSYDFQDDDQIGTIASEGGGFKKLYGPVLCKNDDKVILYIAGQELHVTAKLFKETIIEISGKQVVVQAKFKSFDLTGMGEELCFSLEFFIESSDTLVTFYCGVRVADYEAEYTDDQFNGYGKRSIKSLVEVLGDIPSGEWFAGPTLKLSQLPTNSYMVVGYRGFAVDNRTSYIMRLLVSEALHYYLEPEKRDEPEVQMTPIAQAFDEGVDAFPEGCPQDEEGNLLTQIEVWGNKSIAQNLGFEPVITEEKPAELIIRGAKVRKDKKVNVYCSLIAQTDESSLADDEDLEFDFD